MTATAFRKGNKLAKDKYMEQIYLFIYHIELKLTSNTVQYSVNTCMNVGLQLNTQLSQGSAAIQVRGGSKYYCSFLYSSSGNIPVKELLKLVYIS